jgi:hypothetical protein
MEDKRFNLMLSIAQRLADAEWGTWDEHREDDGVWHRPPWKMGKFWPDLISDARKCVEMPTKEAGDATGI